MIRTTHLLLNRTTHYFICSLFLWMLTGCNNPVELIEPTIAVERVALNTQALNLAIGDSLQLTAEIYPENASDKTLSWSSSHPTIASVSPQGIVSALAQGTAAISATAGEVSTTCAVTIVPKTIAVTAITLQKESLTLIEAETATLTATLQPENATNNTIT